MQEGTAAAIRVFNGIDNKAMVLDSKEPKNLNTPKGRIVFQNVLFTYSDKDIPALENINIEILPGENIAIVGPSGSGKSTIVNLLLRFFDPENGKILFDEIDIKNLKLSELRKNVAIKIWQSNIGYVPQKPLINDFSLRENIAYGDKTASKEKIQRAAIESDAHEFIKRLPKEYDTIVRENGENLSGGEKQRISIARAILKNPALLILDEPTSSLDASTEENIKNSIKRASKHRTTITIAHRISTIKNSDRILVLDKGKIVSQGTHEELFKECSVYRRMSLLQNIDG